MHALFSTIYLSHCCVQLAAAYFSPKYVAKLRHKRMKMWRGDAIWICNIINAAFNRFIISRSLFFYYFHLHFLVATFDLFINICSYPFSYTSTPFFRKYIKVKHLRCLYFRHIFVIGLIEIYLYLFWPKAYKIYSTSCASYLTFFVCTKCIFLWPMQLYKKKKISIIYGFIYNIDIN